MDPDFNSLGPEITQTRKRRRLSSSDDVAAACSPFNNDNNKYIYEDDILIILPLTRSNLRRHHQAMADGSNDGKQDPVTPPKSASDATSTIDTPSRSSKKSKSADAGSIMQWHFIYGPESSRRVWEADKAFRDSVTTLVHGERDSAMRVESANLFQSAREKLRSRNEATLMAALMPVLVKDSRTSMEVNEAAIPNFDDFDDQNSRLMPILLKDSRTSMEVHEAVVRDFDTDYLDKNLDMEFTRGCVPVPDLSTDTLLGSLLAKSPGIKNPKPDIVYGISLDALTPEQLITANKLIESSQLSPGILYPFLIFEWKSAKGSFTEAQDQARRGGTALVNALAKLISLAGSPEAEQAGSKPDIRTIVFSCVITPNFAHIYVHFRQLRPDGTPEWYMAKVSGYQTDEGEDIRRLRRDIHNILDWGVLKRVKDIKELLDRVRSDEPVEILSPETKDVNGFQILKFSDLKSPTSIQKLRANHSD